MKRTKSQDLIFVLNFVFNFLIINFNAFGAFGYNTIDEEEALVPLSQEALNSNSTKQKILIWNIYKEGNKTFKAELAKLNDQLEPGMTLFQEARYLEDVKALCLKVSDCFFSQAFKVEKEAYGVLTSSRYQVLHAEAIHSNSVEPVLYTPKTSLLTIVRVRNSELMVINTHGINFVTLMAYEEQLKEVVEKAKSFNGPILWAGDFNSWNPGRYSLLDKATKDLGLEEIELENSELVKSFLGYKLDRVFARKLKVHQAKAIKSEGSDHNPLFIEVSPLD